MDVDKPADLEFVADDFEEGAHDKLDKNIHDRFPLVNPENLAAWRQNAAFILTAIAQEPGDRLLAKYRNSVECEKLLESNTTVMSMILDGPKDGYKNIRLLKLLRPDTEVSKVQLKEYTKDEAITSSKSWEREYVGDAADALWEHIREWYKKAQSPDAGQSFYAKYVAIVQSSGMGKSRAIDEMSKSRFVIPVILRASDSSGYPPSDKPAYEYLIGSNSQRDAFLRSCSFLHALFLQTATVVEGFKDAPDAGQLREYMKKGMQYDFHGECRRNFHEAVETHAKEVYSAVYLPHFPDEQLLPSHDRIDEKLSSENFPLCAAFRTLVKALGQQSLESPKSPKRQKKDTKVDDPFVVLAFDEVHTLTKLVEPPAGSDNQWSRFIELRRAIRGLKKESLFALFLSTSGTLYSISATTSSDGMIHTENFMLPFCELGFDQFALRINFSRLVLLSRVTSVEHLTSYGRPLWRPHYLEWKDSVMDFAVNKLLGGMNYIDGELTDGQKLACLAQRVPIEFLSAHYISHVSDKEKEQVNSHMRVILKVDRGLQTMATTSPSEPILAEAASTIMSRNPGFDPPVALQKILNGFAVHKGELGELIVALLFVIARDTAVRSAVKTERWCSVTALLQSLFCAPYSNFVDTSTGWHFTSKGTKILQESLANTFKESKVYFSHFVKVHEHKVVHVEFLMRLMVRGAAILCGNNQAGTDGIIPFLLNGDKIEQGNIGVILFQVKNDASFTHNPKPEEVRKMNPRSPTIIMHPDIPVIRFFFALSASTPTLQSVIHATSVKTLNGKGYKSYDFWVAGLSPEILSPVMRNTGAWNAVLQASSRWQQVYKGGSDLNIRLRKSMNPGVAAENPFWVNWCDEVTL
ncbi:hypothetical protein OG21DRAFT_1484826 [Imleria badia]|nr:hypothetical protein OG21DRAFT_1484826 [Imleria badia]